MTDADDRAAVLGAIRGALGRDPSGTGQETWATPGTGQETCATPGTGQETWATPGTGQETWATPGTGQETWATPGTGQETCATPGTGQQTWAPTTPGGPGLQTWAPERLLERFVRMSEEVEAPVSVVSSVEEARARLSEILRAEGARSVVVSPGAAREPWAVVPSVEADGRRAIQRHADAPAREDLLAADAGVTVAAFALADTGTLALVASPDNHRLDSLVPLVHIALLRADTLVADLAAAFARLAAGRTFHDHSAVVLVRGPSRTADIELTLTVGVHGPGRVHVILVTDEC